MSLQQKIAFVRARKAKDSRAGVIQTNSGGATVNFDKTTDVKGSMAVASSKGKSYGLRS